MKVYRLYSEVTSIYGDNYSHTIGLYHSEFTANEIKDKLSEPDRADKCAKCPFIVCDLECDDEDLSCNSCKHVIELEKSAKEYCNLCNIKDGMCLCYTDDEDESVYYTIEECEVV